MCWWPPVAGRRGEANRCYRRAMRMDPGVTPYLQAFAATLGDVDMGGVDSSIVDDLNFALGMEGFEKQGVVKTSMRLIAQKPGIQRLLALSGDDNPEELAREIVSGGIFSVILDPLLLKILDSAVVSDYRFEKLFTDIRRSVLRLTMEDAIPRAIHDDLFSLLCPLAHQCFLNEYVYFRTTEEKRWVATLVEQIEVTFECPMTQPRFQWPLVAAYLPLYQLHRLVTMAEFAETAGVPAFMKLVQHQIKDPLEELRLEKLIKVMTPIGDMVSRAVQAQYEANPFPRWLQVAYQRDSSSTLAAHLQNLFPSFARDSSAVPDAPRVLIAGCGTGKHAIKAAHLYGGARVLAMDLSRASLAYAVRKARELKVPNIEFVQGDILELAGLGRRFDLIESVGVLHHLKDPLTGLQVLADMIDAGGFMKIGLYSETARRHLETVRRLIVEKGYDPSPDGIRRLRRDIFLSGDDELKTKLDRHTDFFSMSQCRDLVFHVQEHRFSLPLIAEMLERLGLTFLGFEMPHPHVIQTYKRQFPEDPGATSLGLWHRYEQQNPGTFMGMYQFWVVKQ